MTSKPNVGLSHSPVLTASICFMIAVFEGYDLQVAGIVAQNLVARFELSTNLLGWFFSASTIGLFFGAILGGKLCDKHSRVSVLAGSVLAFGLASVFTAVSVNTSMLIISRGLTGFGLGGALPALLAMTAENATPGKEKRALALLYSGVPIGGGLVSLIGAAMADNWRMPILIGGIIPVFFAWVIIKYIPKNQKGLETVRENLTTRSALFGEGRAIISILVWLSFFSTLVILYLVLNWLPTLLTSIGVTKQFSFYAQLLFNLGGFLICYSTAFLLDGRKNWIVALGGFSAIPVILYFASLINSDVMAILVAMALGGSVYLTQSFLYALAPTLYPPQGRGIGVGAAVASGRIGSISGPLLGALLISSLGSTSSVLIGVIPIAIIAGICAISLEFLSRRKR